MKPQQQEGSFAEGLLFTHTYTRPVEDGNSASVVTNQANHAGFCVLLALLVLEKPYWPRRDLNFWKTV